VIDAYGADSLRLYLINSPVVRAEDLCFKEQGVLQNLKSIFLPWYHAYRMLVSSTRLQERQEGTPFKPDLAAALASPNLMDRWILASANGLVKFMRSEMEAYRLYTVVPRLLDLIEQLTNWYIRMNRERFSGERGPSERHSSLATLFEVMLMLCRMMAPLTPFFAEHVYQNLRRAILDAPASVHFLMIPEVNDAAVDPQMEADVKMMIAVIEKGRTLRERHNLSMRTPLPEVTLVHADGKALAAIRKLQEYVSEELNVREVHTKSVSEAGGSVTLQCNPNHRRLGDRFGNAYKAIQPKIRALSSEHLSSFMQSGSITIDDEVFDQRDITVDLIYSGDTGNVDADTAGGGVVVLSTVPDADMLDEAMAREVWPERAPGPRAQAGSPDHRLPPLARIMLALTARLRALPPLGVRKGAEDAQGGQHAQGRSPRGLLPLPSASISPRTGDPRQVQLHNFAFRPHPYCRRGAPAPRRLFATRRGGRPIGGSGGRQAGAKERASCARAPRWMPLSRRSCHHQDST
jgi:isoleucyl-tRNA synthetase